MQVVNRKKVRSGCGTCKARKVKCDELKPVCRRCQSACRVCEGYGVWGGGGNGYAERYGKHASLLHRQPRYAQFRLNDEEQGHLEWFHHRLVQDMSGRFAEGFWTALVVPALVQEPVIAHAAIALSLAHKDAVMSGDCPEQDNELFVVSHYNKSLRHLQSAIGLGGKTATVIALISCLLYTLLERLRGRIEQAEMHLQSGLRLLKDVNQHMCVNASGTTLLKRSTAIDAGQVRILQAFASLHLESQLLGICSPGIDLLVQSGLEDVPSQTFRSTDEAKNSLDKLIHAILIISRRFSGIAPVASHHRLSVPEIQGQVLGLLEAWLRTYKATIIRETSKVRQSAYEALLSHHEMAFVMCGHIGCTSESGYMLYTSNFVAILENSVNLWRSLPALSPSQRTITEDNLLTPLFFTALKCRVRRIRFQAARLLDVIPGSQGGRSSRSMAIIATKVIALEQGDSSKAECDFALTEIPVLSELDSLIPSTTNLIREVRVRSCDESPDRLVLRCEQWGNDHELKIFYHYVRKSRQP